MLAAAAWISVGRPGDQSPCSVPNSMVSAAWPGTATGTRGASGSLIASCSRRVASASNRAMSSRSPGSAFRPRAAAELMSAIRARFAPVSGMPTTDACSALIRGRSSTSGAGPRCPCRCPPAGPGTAGPRCPLRRRARAGRDVRRHQHRLEPWRTGRATASPARPSGRSAGTPSAGLPRRLRAPRAGRCGVQPAEGHGTPVASTCQVTPLARSSTTRTAEEASPAESVELRRRKSMPVITAARHTSDSA